MTNAKKEFTREEVESMARWLSVKENSMSPLLEEMMSAFAARLAEDEASKPVWVNGQELAHLREWGEGLISMSSTEMPGKDTPLYTRSKP